MIGICATHMHCAQILMEVGVKRSGFDENTTVDCVIRNRQHKNVRSMAEKAMYTCDQIALFESTVTSSVSYVSGLANTSK